MVDAQQRVPQRTRVEVSAASGDLSPFHDKLVRFFRDIDENVEASISRTKAVYTVRHYVKAGEPDALIIDLKTKFKGAINVDDSRFTPV